MLLALYCIFQYVCAHYIIILLSTNRYAYIVTVYINIAPCTEMNVAHILENKEWFRIVSRAPYQLSTCIPREFLSTFIAIIRATVKEKN